MKIVCLLDWRIDKMTKLKLQVDKNIRNNPLVKAANRAARLGKVGQAKGKVKPQLKEDR